MTEETLCDTPYFDAYGQIDLNWLAWRIRQFDIEEKNRRV